VLTPNCTLLFLLNTKGITLIGCIIFDCDGTLVDSERLGHIVLAEHFFQHGIEVSAHSLHDEFKGGHFASMIDVLERRHETVLPADFIASYRDRAELVYEAELQACIGVEEALQALDLPLCIASNAPTKKTKKSLEITGLSQHFGDRIFSAYDINAWKPKPDLFLHAAKHMGVEAEQCVVIEDSSPGVQAALAANMHTVLVDYNGVQKDVQNVWRIDNMLKLSQVLQQLSH